MKSVLLSIISEDLPSLNSTFLLLNMFLGSAIIHRDDYKHPDSDTDDINGYEGKPDTRMTRYRFVDSSLQYVFHLNK